MMAIPFSFFPPGLTVRLSEKFKGTGDFVFALYPALSESLLQARMGVNPRDYAAATVFTTITYVLLGIILSFVFAARASQTQFEAKLFVMLLAFSMFISLGVFFTILTYPKIIVTKRARKIDSELVSATRQLLVEIKAGVPLFNAMTSISTGYGAVSEEFARISQKVSSGKNELAALSEATRENASLAFRKVLWQVSNALKVGSDVSKALEYTLVELEKDKMEQIHKYGQELSPWTMMYMMVAVVLPSLGITMLIVISSFLGLVIPKITLLAVLLFLVGFQFFFFSFVSSRRPAI